MKLKFLLVNAINKDRDIELLLPPLGLGYLISYSQKHFGKDLINFKIIDDHVKQTIRELKPDLVGIASVSQNYNRAKQYAAITKEQRLPVIIGKIHISTMPTTLTKDMDIAVIGEGEETVAELLELCPR